jgi:hypothetical protein
MTERLDLRAWARTQRQKDVAEAYFELRSINRVAERMFCSKQGVHQVLGVLQRRALMAERERLGLDVRQISTSYDADGNKTAEHVKEGPENVFDGGGEGASPARDGHTGYKIKGISTLYGPDGEQRAQWVKTTEDAAAKAERMEQIARAWIDEMPRVVATQAPAFHHDDMLTFYPQGDPHAGLRAWAAETGQHFDLKEFERVQIAAVEALVRRSPPAAIAIFNDKGDSTHADNRKNRTPRSGHELDVDGRHSEVIRVAQRVKRRQIQMMLEHHQQVIVRIDPGNHDEETALLLAMLIEAHYEHEPRVQVITSPNPYWYYRFGKCLFGTCHGDGAKGSALPLIMANDVPDLWGATEHRIWFVGHVHHKDIKDYTGCTVEYHRTLAAPDAYSNHAGYRSKRSMEAITYHGQHGEAERHTVWVPSLV